MTTIDLDKMIQAVRDIAAENPEHVYKNPNNVWTGGPECLYLHGDEPGCIMGHAAVRVGIPPNEVGTWDEMGDISSVLYRIFDYDEIHERKIQWITRVQSRQDYGDSWSVAVDVADAEYPEVAK